MARTAKKEKALTPGKKLAQALVPEGEQPYQVPKNWCWVVQGRVSTFFNGRAYKQAVNAKFLWYYMLSDDFVLQASTAGSRSVLPKINQKELASLKIQVTDFKEQEQVVTVLDKLFEKEQQAKEAAEQVIDQIDAMKKSILARAFRGELGTNAPNDETTDMQSSIFIKAARF